MGEKRTVRNMTEANWKWACESEENFRSFTDEVRSSARRAGRAEGLKDAAKLVGDKATTLLRRASEYEREGRAWDAEHQRGKALELAAAALLARAEEVERE